MHDGNDAQKDRCPSERAREADKVLSRRSSSRSIFCKVKTDFRLIVRGDVLWTIEPEILGEACPTVWAETADGGAATADEAAVTADEAAVTADEAAVTADEAAVTA